MAFRFQSPLSNLCDVLGQIKDSAKQYQSILTKNEASTRAVLIDPVLSALGWDTANTHMVEIEKTLGQVRADYVLCDNNKEPRIIVEAKALGINLNQPQLVMSLVKYAFQFQLNDVFLTDGLIWHHYNNFKPGSVVPTKVLDIIKDNPVEIAAYLVQQIDAAKFWPVENIDLLAQRIEQLESTVATLQRLLPPQTGQQLQGSALTTIIPSSTSSFSSSSLNGQAALVYTDLTSLTDVTGKRPTYLRLPDGSPLAVKRWKDVLRECCKFALAGNPSIPIPLPDRAGKKVSLFSTAKPVTGVSYVTEQYNGQTIFIYVNYDANNCVANALHVLQYVSGSSSTTAAVVLDQ